MLTLEGFGTATVGQRARGARIPHTRGDPDVILLDLMMPVMDGWEFRRQQQADPRSRRAGHRAVGARSGARRRRWTPRLSSRSRSISIACSSWSASMPLSRPRRADTQALGWHAIATTPFSARSRRQSSASSPWSCDRALGLAVVETGWAKNRIRALIVRQANQYLTATLEIGRLEGSLLRGHAARRHRASRDGQTLIPIDEVARQLQHPRTVPAGTVIRRIRLTRPRIVGARGRTADGISARSSSATRASRSAPGRTGRFEIQSIEVIDGRSRCTTRWTSARRTYRPTSNTSTPVHVRLRAGASGRWTSRASPGTATRRTYRRSARGRSAAARTGWFFDSFVVATPRGQRFTLDGTIDTATKPTMLESASRAARFAFQEWSGVIRGLKNIAVEADFDTSLKGPVDRLGDRPAARRNRRRRQGRPELDTTVPGWHGAGAVDVERLNLARWLNRRDRPSDITGHVDVRSRASNSGGTSLAASTLSRPARDVHGLRGDNVRARGQLTDDRRPHRRGHRGRVRRGRDDHRRDASASTRRFRSAFRGHDRYRPAATAARPFRSRMSRACWRSTTTSPASSPIRSSPGAPRSRDRSSSARPSATAPSARSTRSEAASTTPATATIDGIELRRFGEGLDVGWLQRSALRRHVSGRFHVDGAGTTAADDDAERRRASCRVPISSAARCRMPTSRSRSPTARCAHLRRPFDGIDPAVPFDDPRLEASLSGRARRHRHVRDLLTRTPTLADYDVERHAGAAASRLRDCRSTRRASTPTLQERHAHISPTRAARARDRRRGQRHGRAWPTPRTSDFGYDITRARSRAARAAHRTRGAGTLSTKGRLTGPRRAAVRRRRDHRPARRRPASRR